MRLLRLLYTVPLRLRSLFRAIRLSGTSTMSFATTLNGESRSISRDA
jgi:hypothetical protein